MPSPQTTPPPPPPPPPPQGSTSLLRDNTVDLITKDFESWGHKVSDQNRAAIIDLARTLASMVNGQLPHDDKFYLSSMDVGQGKTTTIKRFLGVLLSTPQEITADNRKHSEVGVLLCLSTYAEIKAFVEGLSIDHRKNLFVLTSTNTPKGRQCRSMGKAPSVKEAQLVITTHKRVEDEFMMYDVNSKPVDFWATSAFWYKHGIRRLRIWDESFLPSKPQIVSAKDMSALAQALAGPAPKEFVQGLLRLAADILGQPNRSLFQVPDLWSSAGASRLNELIASWGTVSELNHSKSDRQDTLRQDLARTLEAIKTMSGKRVSVRTIMQEKSNVAGISYKPIMPEDFRPILITDASGRVRRTYKEMEVRGQLERLQESAKDYSNLEVNWVNRGGGKSSWAAQFKDLVAVTCKLITAETSADKEQLVIHHKEKIKGHYRGCFSCPKEAILEHLEQHYPDYDRDLLHFLTWGQHRATNEYRDIPVVTLAGTLFKDDATYEALQRLSRELRPEDGNIDGEEFRVFKLGEYGDDILQAAGRGSLRRNDPREPFKCPRGSRLNIIMSSRGGVEGEFDRWFPGCQLIRKGDMREGKGNTLVGEVLKYLKAWKQTHKPGDEVTFSRVNKDLQWKKHGIPSKRMQDTVRASLDFKTDLKGLGVSEVTTEGGYRLTRWKIDG